ncbi:sulfurtransferase [Azohydromonas sp.]|uniref:sulfurtransferase n=1 Tax=Azohydromonas sp. TaxID=1872666 RepID=UPI002CED69AD|nr:sulfurtransferase [Azohydromonas sp.]HMM85228.1 sulfurtransferase [Azohydromonas sp.]
MTHHTLIRADTLLERLRHGTPTVLLDCGFDLFDPAAGERAYAAGHLPGAHYLHLERDLSGPTRDAAGRFRGRHPLPARDAWAALVARLGIAPGVQVVAYDAQGGPCAARAWWLLRWIGHDAAAVLDGGVAAWQAAGGTLTTAAPGRLDAAPYPARADAMPLVDAAALQARLGRVCLLDARAGERFRGEVEPLDAAAGHVPGALHRFFMDNLRPDGRFKDAATLRAELLPLVGAAAPADVVHMCGSGVTACHNLLALAHAGLGTGALYPGSWSEWSSDPARALARDGAAPGAGASS